MAQQKFITAKDRTPAERKQAREDARRWAKNVTRDRCGTCGNYYNELSPRTSCTEVHERYAQESVNQPTLLSGKKVA